MILSSRPSRWLLLFLVIFVAVGTLPLSANAADPTPGADLGAATRPTALVAAFTDSVLGNRQRMIQYAFAGFGIGVLILVTATRKH